MSAENSFMADWHAKVKIRHDAEIIAGLHDTECEHRDNGRGVSELVEVGEPILVRCAVQDAREWSTEEEDRTHGVQILSLRRLFSKTWPGDVNSHVYHKGDKFESVGFPQHRDMSRHTEHWSITLRWIGKDDREK